MTGSFGLLSEEDDRAHYGDDLAHEGDDWRDAQQYEPCS